MTFMSAHRKIRRVALAGVLTLLATTVLALAAPSANAYRTFPQLCGAGKWTANTEPVWINGNSNQVPTSWTSAISSSRAAWNGITGANFSYQAPVRVTSGPLPPRGASGVAVRLYDIQSNDGIPADVPAWTSNLDPLTVNHSIAYVNLSSRWTWNLTGVLNQSKRQADVRTVVTHEMGHANGLAHPWQANCAGTQIRTLTAAETASVMNASFGKKWAINSDDRAAMASIY